METNAVRASLGRFTRLTGEAAESPREKAISRKHTASTQLSTPDVAGKLAAQGYEISGLGPEGYAASIRASLAKWANVIRVANLRQE